MHWTQHPCDVDSRLRQECSFCAGDVKLSELKAALAKKGISAEFVAGSLVCAASILVRRTDDDTGLVLEGPLSDDFYTVRSILYGQYKVC